MRKCFIALSLILTLITIFTGCSFANISLMETTTAELVTLPDVATTEVSITEENTTTAPIIETTTVEEITTAIQELITNEYVTSAPETTTIIPETTTEATVEIWKNEKIGLSFNTGYEYKLYDANNINSIMDLSMFDSIGFVPEMLAMNDSGSKSAAVVTGSNATFNSKLIVTAMKMVTSFSDNMKYVGSGKETIAGKTYDFVSMSMTAENDNMYSDFLLREEGNTLIMIMLIYADASEKAGIISCFK